MNVTEEDIQKFQSIYKQELGKEITKEEAYEKAIKLLLLLKLVYRPITKKAYLEALFEINKIRGDLYKRTNL